MSTLRSDISVIPPKADDLRSQATLWFRVKARVLHRKALPFDGIVTEGALGSKEVLIQWLDFEKVSLEPTRHKALPMVQMPDD